MSFLPIHDCLPDLLRALRERPCAVLVAPPGAGKTTVVPLALAQTEWAMGQKILVLEPRRLAARAAAARMATTLGESVGQTVGFRVRGESRVSPKTRIEVVTEGIFTRMILDDPGLDGVAAVLFDEFHERSLDADLGLAFARESQQALREDLRLLVMSATLDGTRIAALLDNAPVIESEGRAFPVETRYLGRDQTLRLEDDMVRAIFRALHQTDGSVLAFLPGQGEIKRVEERLRDKGLPDGVQLCPLYGAMDPKAQDQAIRPAPLGQRKIVLATAIAETSLTIDGVTVVVDSGFARVPRYDPATAQVRLETVRVTRAAADQRRGRAGRTAPGVCFRLWDAEQDRSLVPFISPEILNTDLSRLVMDLALWGARDPEGLAFLDLPPKAALAEARTLLRSLQALDDQGGLTPHGRTLARLPLSPRLAHMLCVAADLGQARLGADMAALLSERGLGGTSADLSTRLAVFRRDQSAKAKTARQLATDWSRLVQETRKAQSEDTGRTTDAEAALLLAEAWPERVALPRAGKPGTFVMANGRGVFVEPSDALARAEALAVGDLGGGSSQDRILLAAPLDPEALKTRFKDRLVRQETITLDDQGRVRAVSELCLGKLVLESRRLDSVTPAMLAEALKQEVLRKGLSVLAFGEESQSLRSRVAFLRGFDPEWPDLSDAALMDRLDDWLTPILGGVKRLSDLSDSTLAAAVGTLIPWALSQSLDKLAPERLSVPTGSRLRIDYAAEGGPRLAVRVQELYGLKVHPSLAGGKVPLTLSLLSPAQRPVQTTRDLPGFWAGSWKEVRTEMKGRYPRHVWPEDPANADPTTRAKPRGT